MVQPLTSMSSSLKLMSSTYSPSGCSDTTACLKKYVPSAVLLPSVKLTWPPATLIESASRSPCTSGALDPFTVPTVSPAFPACTVT